MHDEFYRETASNSAKFIHSRFWVFFGRNYAACSSSRRKYLRKPLRKCRCSMWWQSSCRIRLKSSTIKFASHSLALCLILSLSLLFTPCICLYLALWRRIVGAVQMASGLWIMYSSQRGTLRSKLKIIHVFFAPHLVSNWKKGLWLLWRLGWTGGQRQAALVVHPKDTHCI